MEDMSAVAATIFDKNYELHQKHLRLKGLQPKTIEAYSRAIRRVGDYFALRIDVELPLLGRQVSAWFSSGLSLLGRRVIHGAAAGPSQARGERRGG